MKMKQQVKGMYESKYYDQNGCKENSSNEKKEKSRGIIQKFFDLWRFKEDEQYY